MDKYKKFMYIGIFILLISLVGSAGTYAWFTWISPSNTSVTLSIGNLADVTFTSGPDINITNLAPVYNYTDGEKATFSINNRDTTNTFLRYKVLLNINSIDTELKNPDLKYKLFSNNIEVSNGDFTGANNGITMTIFEDMLSAGTTNFVFYLYIDGNNDNNLNMINRNINAALRVTTEESPVNFSEYLESLYNNGSKTAVTNNSIQYNYISSLSLMNDRSGGITTDLNGGNIRYYGADPSNYVYFNCDAYPSTNCELWRIVGVFDNKIKLVRNENIGKFSWDNKDRTTGAETNYGKNNWSEARLMKLLNPGYNTETNGGSLYYNSTAGNCYVNQNNTIAACDFTSNGIKNEKTKNIILNTVWKLGGYSSADVYSNQIYSYERGSTVYNGRETTWTGKVALLYPSDYGYASDFNKCQEMINNYNNSSCSSNNWIFNMGSLWLLTSDSKIADRSWSINSSGNASVNGNGKGSCANTLLAFPTLYISSDTKIISGNGSLNNPYKLSV